MHGDVFQKEAQGHGAEEGMDLVAPVREEMVQSMLEYAEEKVVEEGGSISDDEEKQTLPTTDDEAEVQGATCTLRLKRRHLSLWQLRLLCLRWHLVVEDLHEESCQKSRGQCPGSMKGTSWMSSTENLPKKQRPMPRKHERDLLDERVKIAEDMLASVNGIELYTSVSGGHFMAFCKAANAGCKTKVKSIMDEKSYLDVGKLKKDFVFKKLLVLNSMHVQCVE